MVRRTDLFDRAFRRKDWVEFAGAGTGYTIPIDVPAAGIGQPLRLTCNRGQYTAGDAASLGTGVRIEDVSPEGSTFASQAVVSPSTGPGPPPQSPTGRRCVPRYVADPGGAVDPDDKADDGAGHNGTKGAGGPVAGGIVTQAITLSATVDASGAPTGDEPAGNGYANHTLDITLAGPIRIQVDMEVCSHEATCNVGSPVGGGRLDDDIDGGGKPGGDPSTRPLPKTGATTLGTLIWLAALLVGVGVALKALSRHPAKPELTESDHMPSRPDRRAQVKVVVETMGLHPARRRLGRELR